MDLSGLLVQGLAVPAAAVALAAFMRRSFPAAAGALAVPSVVAFSLNFVVVDYLYYWNHRLLHGPLWRWHAAHHSARAMDVLMTARNTLWTPALIVYVWSNAAFVWLLGDARPYLAAAALSSLLDAWRHSAAWPENPGAFWTGVSRALITPRDHAWHHSRDRHDSNFGANLKLWDRLHGTLWDPAKEPEAFGVDVSGNLWRKLVLP